ncbi:hypothetical protein AQUCO_02300027v1 [Aquilegia coerulea]|uniref:Uncharacterized protein n=1 Tax=Aquilegia coerulea TaxID=218851 RepID=A0A2G5DBT7_AQUCA|nr:hypothetical protein AQUCO_02300027v1 [Aquilegia coerulea]
MSFQIGLANLKLFPHVSRKKIHANGIGWGLDMSLVAKLSKGPITYLILLSSSQSSENPKFGLQFFF